MKVLKVSFRNSYRAYKQAEALREKGIEVDLVTAQGVDLKDYTFDAYETNPKASLYQIPTWTAGPTQIVDTKALKKAIKLSSPDVIQYHNPPDYHLIDIKQICNKIPVIIDMADIYSLGIYNAIDVYSGVEHHSLNIADGIVNVSDYLKKAMIKKYPDLKDKPNTVLANYSLLRQIPEYRMPKLSKKVLDKYLDLTHLVYAGSFWDRNTWRRIGLVLSPISQIPKMRVHIYSREGVKFVKRWDKKGIFHIKSHKCVRSDILTKELTQYDLAWCGFTDINPLLKGALPNKLYEAYAANIPICTQKCYTEMTKFIEENNCGFIFTNTNDFIKGVEKWKDKTYKPDKKEFLDYKIKNLIELFEKLI